MRRHEIRDLGLRVGTTGSGACGVRGEFQSVEPAGCASSATQTSYAVDYPVALQSVANDYVNSEGEVRRLTTEFARTPASSKIPPWPVVANIVQQADEAGQSASYVAGRRQYEGVQEFFTEEHGELSRRVIGSAQYVAKKKECDIDVSGAIYQSLKEGVDKQLEKRLRAHDEATTLIERYREVLGKANATALEKQVDEISAASYITNVRTTELKASAVRLLDESSQIKKTLDRSIADERAFQAENGRSAADKKASNERIAKMEDGKLKIDSAVPQIQALNKEIDERNSAMKKEYALALDNLKKAIAAKISATTE